MSYALYGIMSYCAFMDIRCYRIPNRALAAAAAVGLAVTVGAWVSGAGNVGLWAAGMGFWLPDTGFWAAAAAGAAVFIMRLVLAAAAGFPFFRNQIPEHHFIQRESQKTAGYAA